MPRIPSRLQIAPYGTRNPAAPGRTIVPSVQSRGPTQALETFPDVADPSIRRALQQIQQAVARATSQAKAAPFARSNVLFGVLLTAGGANGANPVLVAHGLDVQPSGCCLLATRGGYVSGPAVIIPNPSNIPKTILQVWLSAVTAFAGKSVTGDLLVYA